MGNFVVEKNLDKIIGVKEHAATAKPENIIKQLSNGHALLAVKRTRLKGFCVSCIKQLGRPDYKSVLSKVTTNCPACDGGIWICEPCFDREHEVIQFV